MIKRTPNDSLTTLLKTYESDFVDLGGKLEDINKPKKKTK